MGTVAGAHRVVDLVQGAAEADDDGHKDEELVEEGEACNGPRKEHVCVVDADTAEDAQVQRRLGGRLGLAAQQGPR